jgi:hypothetical protein
MRQTLAAEGFRVRERGLGWRGDKRVDRWKTSGIWGQKIDYFLGAIQSEPNLKLRPFWDFSWMFHVELLPFLAGTGH